jgi:hypothetical protein
VQERHGLGGVGSDEQSNEVQALLTLTANSSQAAVPSTWVCLKFVEQSSYKYTFAFLVAVLAPQATDPNPCQWLPRKYTLG